MHDEVLEKGILPVDDEGRAIDPEDNTVIEDAPKVKLPPEDGDERDAAILTVIKKIVSRNNPADFSAGGTPNAGSITSALGYRVDQKEVRKVWEKNRAVLLNGKSDAAG